jgi:hypothetical protein
MSQLLWDLPPRVGSLLLHCHLRRSNNLVDQQKRTNNLHGAFFSTSVFLCLMLSDCHGFLHGLLLLLLLLLDFGFGHLCLERLI